MNVATIMSATAKFRSRKFMGVLFKSAIETAQFVESKVSFIFAQPPSLPFFSENFEFLSIILAHNNISNPKISW